MKKLITLICLFAVNANALTKEQIEEKFNLPPEPDVELNNSTILGIDSNNNGIRDDWERAIAFEYYQDLTLMNLHNLFALNISRSIKAFSGNDGKSYADAQMEIKEIIDCSHHLYGLEFDSNLFYLSKNTINRENYILNADSEMERYLDKSFYDGYSYEYLDKVCSGYKK
jgi:hypothetical protein